MSAAVAVSAVRARVSNSELTMQLFMRKILPRCCFAADWIRDAEGRHWFLGVKSYLLTTEGYANKMSKPTVLDREMLSLNDIKRPAKGILK
jgi:hypothetical protein